LLLIPVWPVSFRAIHQERRLLLHVMGIPSCIIVRSEGVYGKGLHPEATEQV